MMFKQHKHISKSEKTCYTFIPLYSMFKYFVADTCKKLVKNKNS